MALVDNKPHFIIYWRCRRILHVCSYSYCTPIKEEPTKTTSNQPNNGYQLWMSLPHGEPLRSYRNYRLSTTGPDSDSLCSRSSPIPVLGNCRQATTSHPQCREQSGVEIPTSRGNPQGVVGEILELWSWGMNMATHPQHRRRNPWPLL